MNCNGRKNVKITDFFSLLGGLALFLYGMQMMSNGLEAAAGNKMKQILEKLTANRFLGVLVGAGITAVIQSSSATTVMVVGFVNSGMMTLKLLLSTLPQTIRNTGGCPVIQKLMSVPLGKFTWALLRQPLKKQSRTQ